MINLKTKIKAVLFDIGGPIDSEILNDKLLKLHFIEEFSKHNITIDNSDIETGLGDDIFSAVSVAEKVAE